MIDFKMSMLDDFDKECDESLPDGLKDTEGIDEHYGKVYQKNRKLRNKIEEKIFSTLDQIDLNPDLGDADSNMAKMNVMNLATSILKDGEKAIHQYATYKKGNEIEANLSENRNTVLAVITAPVEDLMPKKSNEELDDILDKKIEENGLKISEEEMRSDETDFS